MLGQAIQRINARKQPDFSITAPHRKELDLLDQAAVRNYLQSHKFDAVIHTAAKVGGIKANQSMMSAFLTENIQINTNIIEESRKAGIEKFIYLGSSCMYPRNFNGMLQEDDVLKAPLEPTNEGYAIAKIAGQRACQYITREYGVSYKTLIPCNLYGPGDHYDPEHSHLMAAIIRKTHNAILSGSPDIEIWGTGTPRREFVFVDDLAGFILDKLEQIDSLPDILNTGMGKDHSVEDYYRKVANITGFKGTFTFNHSAPDGMTHKLMDCHKAATYGWKPETSLEDGITAAYGVRK